MNHEFGNIGRRLPYDLPEHRLEALHTNASCAIRRHGPHPLPAPAGFTWRQG